MWLAFWFRGQRVLLSYASGRLRMPPGDGLSGSPAGCLATISDFVSGFWYQLRIGLISFPLQFRPSCRIPRSAPDPYAMLEISYLHGICSRAAGTVKQTNQTNQTNQSRQGQRQSGNAGWDRQQQQARGYDRACCC
ncbi:hypothetical protein NicSoilB4_19540 [Arthrobacter sp. NicSoilB4]|nr:hypothetical protein NicSoilB4_19540 [Arthrobacter sp. NicSoilB4]